MIKTGLVSVTFRKFTPAEIIKLVKQAELDGVEWGGDVHVPHGNKAVASEVFKLTRDAGLEVASYGSYYKAGLGIGAQIEFERVLETAVELHAPTIRIWAGEHGTVEADSNVWEAVSSDILSCARIAGKEGITVSLEFHKNTLTDTAEGAQKLLDMVNHENLFTYWQPPIGTILENNLVDIEKLMPRISNIHAYVWEQTDRMPLSSGEQVWEKYLGEFKANDKDRYCMLEFVKDARAEQFLEDAKVLKRICNGGL